ncbi:hypothetical protein N9R79_07425 [Vibrio sp.]|nr:hypothetical protein [Vibrio sp.]
MTIKKSILAVVLSVAATGAAVAGGHKALEYMAIKSSDVQLIDIIKTIGDNETITDIELDDENKQMVFEVKTIDLTADKEYERVYSLEDGRVLEEESESLSFFGVNDLDERDEKAINAVKASSVQLESLIPSLESKYQGKVLEVELEHKKGISFYEVKMFTDKGMRQKILVNLDNGEEIPVMHHKGKHKH